MNEILRENSDLRHKLRFYIQQVKILKEQGADLEKLKLGGENETFEDSSDAEDKEDNGVIDDIDSIVGEDHRVIISCNQEHLPSLDTSKHGREMKVKVIAEKELYNLDYIKMVSLNNPSVENNDTKAAQGKDKNTESGIRETTAGRRMRGVEVMLSRCRSVMGMRSGRRDNTVAGETFNTDQTFNVGKQGKRINRSKSMDLSRRNLSKYCLRNGAEISVQDSSGQCKDKMEFIRRWQQQVSGNTALCHEDDNSDTQDGEHELSQSFYSLYFPYKQMSDDSTDSLNTDLDL